jgi:RNA polymerase sigma factor (sigma-70 family)
MATANLNVCIRRLARGMQAETLGDQSDQQLIDRFLAARDETAFEAMVRRHGPMVYRVCWRALQQEQAAEDAFQATFLVLAQKLRTLRKQASLGSWLHGVARRVALKAKTRAVTRGRHERRAAASRAVPADDVTWQELRVVLDAELARLPDKWRLPLILCYLESRTQDEAAEQLGLSKNSLRRRLEEARKALARRLVRSGVGPAALSAVLLSDCTSPAALPPRLIASTVEAAARVATGQAAAAVASAGVASLVAEEGMTVLRTVTIVLALLLTGGLVATVADLSVLRPPDEPPQIREASGLPMRLGEPRTEGNNSLTAGALAGTWRMELPAGFKYQVLMRPLDERRVSVHDAVLFSGTYELRQGRFILVQAANHDKTDFEWEVRGTRELVLVAQPPVAKIGSNYLGTTLRRLPDEGQPIPLPQVGPTDGRPELPFASGWLPRDDRAPRGVQEAVKPPEGQISPQEAAAGRALQRIKAEYRLKKEPAYQGPVQYCLLVLGRDARTRVWLVSDGKTMYVDKNGDGDLTEPAEAIPFKPDKDGGFASLVVDRLPGHAGDDPHTSLHIAVRQRDWKNNKGGYWCVRAKVEGRYPMYAFVHKFAQKPDSAPVIHLGGPLHMGLYSLESGRLLRGHPCELHAYVGCHYPGVERAFVDADAWDCTGMHPVAEIRVPARAPGAAPIALEVPLTQHC